MKGSAERNEKSIVGATMMRIGPLYINGVASLTVYNLAQPHQQSVRVFLSLATPSITNDTFHPLQDCRRIAKNSDRVS